MKPRHKPPFLSIVILLALSLAVFSSALNWPDFGWLFRASPRSGAGKPEVKVWVNKRSGLYYCRGSNLYGKLAPGEYKFQGQAVQSGYRPAGGEACR